MGVYIKGMKIPKSCSNCLFFVDGLYDANDELCSACLAKKDNSPSGCGYGEIDGIDHTKGRMCWCPLVEVPEPHGRLIDADATMKQWGLNNATKYGNKTAEQQHFSYSTIMMYEIADILDDAPVVIEAEGEG